MSEETALAPASAEDRFEDVLRALANDRKLAAIAKAFREQQTRGASNKFGSNALKVNGKIFAMLVRGRLVVKLSKDRAGDLVKSGDGAHFDPGHGRLMKQWIVIENDALSWIDLVREAHAFTAGTGR
jgi:hypothetical protein